jgi:glycine cleavage system H lipoate-binding protein
MKSYKGNIWTDTKSDGMVDIGFTQMFIHQKMMECFHVLQADAVNLNEKGPMLVIETNDGLENLRSPVTGKIIFFNTKARNFPDQLTEDDVILSVLPKGVLLPKTAKKEVKSAMDDWPDPFVEIEDIQREWAPLAPPQQAPGQVQAAPNGFERWNFQPGGFVNQANPVDAVQQRLNELANRVGVRRNGGR